jgi:hypothetical protein
VSAWGDSWGISWGDSWGPTASQQGGRKTFFDRATPSKPIDQRIVAHQELFDAQARQRRNDEELLVIAAAIACISGTGAQMHNSRTASTGRTR